MYDEDRKRWNEMTSTGRFNFAVDHACYSDEAARFLMNKKWEELLPLQKLALATAFDEDLNSD